MTTMASNYPSQGYPIPDNVRTQYAYQQPSPANSASPNSPRMNDFMQPQAPNPYKQLRPLKSPLYVPAVLRPTEHFSSPATPPKSQHGSLDSLPEAEVDAIVRAAQIKMDLEAMDHSWVSHEELGEVTGPPTREHWKPDEASPTCDSAQCRSNFNLFIRKHHCRHCGHIFCSSHVPHTIPLDQEAKFHPNGTESKACETCYNQFQKWDTARSLRRKNSDGSREEDNQSGPPTPLAGPGSHRRMISGGRMDRQPQQPVNSVPKDWAWSTF
jgi:hypothetical protein